MEVRPLERQHRFMEREHEESGKVWVYQYMYWDAQLNADRRSDIFATLETINLGLGKVIHNSGMKVNEQDVSEGVYTRNKQEAFRSTVERAP